ncbi:FUSC family protein [Mycoplasma sp. P36-A1]|uniref:FUSC family protein n=1 Tax=Mycoplasma sp. P36-A1 TaxID=3252900 RepID=UPI003C306879
MYQLLQLSPKTLKEMIKDSDSSKEKKRCLIAITLRNFLLILFAIVYISFYTVVFGIENSSIAVGSFCILLGIRFISYNINIKESIAILALYFILTFVANLVSLTNNLYFSLISNFLFLLLIIILVTAKPIMGNAGIYVFSYIFIVETPVATSLLSMRFYALLFSFITCGLILYKKHYKKDKNKHTSELLKQFLKFDFKSLWQLRLATGVSLALFIGHLLQFERAVWIGYACMSILLPYQNNLKTRAFHRFSGVVVGSLTFGLISSVIPADYYSLIGPIAGLCIGFSVTYFWHSVFNCFGALLLASSLYGIDSSILFRIENNLFGILFAVIFVFLLTLLTPKNILETT